MMKESPSRLSAPLGVLGAILFVGTVAGAATVPANPPQAGADEVLVTSFGAKPDDGQDDTKGIKAAIAHCRDAQIHRLVLPKGRYDFDEAELPPDKRALSFEGFQGITVDGNGSTLVFRGRANPFYFQKCSGVLLKNLTIDWERPFFSQGRVLEAHDLTFDVEVDKEFPVDGTEKFEALMDYDPESRLPIGNLDVLANSGIASCELLRPQVLRLTLKTPTNAKQEAHFRASIAALAGKLLVLRHVVYGNYGVDLINCSGCRLEDVSIYSVPGMGIHAQQSRDISLQRVQVRIRPGSGRLMSTTADCQFYTHCVGSVTIEDSFFEGMGDDGLNVCAKYRVVSKLTGPASLDAIYPAPFWRGPTPETGDTLEFSGIRDLVVHSSATVRAASWDDAAKVFHVEFTEPVPAKVKVGDYLAIQRFMPRAVVRNSTFRGMRSRAMLFSTRDVLVENCKVEAPGFAGIMLQGGIRSGYQGPATRQVVIRNNTFDGCGGTAIYADASVPGPRPGAHLDLAIEGNTFRANPRLDGLRFKKDHPDWVYWNSGVCLTAVDGITIRDNRFSGLQPAVYLRKVANVEIANNTSEPQAAIFIDPKEAETIRAHDNLKLAVEGTATNYDYKVNYINILR